MNIAGIGDNSARFNVYIGNRFDYNLGRTADGEIRPLKLQEIHAIGQACGNGWRKVFNVYAKLVYALCSGETASFSYHSWQHYRDAALLQDSSDTALIFEPPNADRPNTLHIVMGRTYANTLALPDTLVWVNKEFAIDRTSHLIVCPYFDYRQLSNHKIIFLVDLLRHEFGAPLRHWGGEL